MTRGPIPGKAGPVDGPAISVWQCAQEGSEPVEVLRVGEARMELRDERAQLPCGAQRSEPTEERVEALHEVGAGALQDPVGQSG